MNAESAPRVALHQIGMRRALVRKTGASPDCGHGRPPLLWTGIMRVFRRHLRLWVAAWIAFQVVSLSAFVPRDCCAAHRPPAEEAGGRCRTCHHAGAGARADAGVHARRRVQQGLLVILGALLSPHASPRRAHPYRVPWRSSTVPNWRPLETPIARPQPSRLSASAKLNAHDAGTRVPFRRGTTASIGR